MKTISVPRTSELQVWLDDARRELVRAFVREASLSDGAPAVAAGHTASDTAAVWGELCALASGGGRARIVVLAARQEIRTHIFLRGHSQFSGIATCLARRIHVNSGISWREQGIDGWEISIRHSFALDAE